MKDIRLTLVLLAAGAWGGFYIGRSYERNRLEPQIAAAQKHALDANANQSRWHEAFDALEARCK